MIVRGLDMKLRRVLIIGGFGIVGVWLLMLFEFWIVRFSPLTYWGKQRLNFLNVHPVVRKTYATVFASPLATIFPRKQAVLTFPVPRMPLMIVDRDAYNVYTYEGFGKVERIDWISDQKAILGVKLESGREEDFSYRTDRSVYLEATPDDRRGNLYYELTSKSFGVRQASLYLGDWVRIRWISHLGLDKYRKSNEPPTSEQEPILVLQKMPDWVKYD